MRRVIRLNDALPKDKAGRWVRHRVPWLSVNRVSGHITALKRPDYDPGVSQVKWFRDYGASCDLTSSGKSLCAVVAQVTVRKPFLSKKIAAFNAAQLTPSRCDPAEWERDPLRITFHPAGRDAISYDFVPGSAVLVQDTGDDDAPAASTEAKGQRDRGQIGQTDQQLVLLSRTLAGGSVDSFDDLLHKAERAHGHLCAGQILGVRMALLGLERLGIADPHGTDRKRLITCVEIDRCATDAISLVTGCRLGKRSLKFRDWGKMAATFVDIQNHRAIRIVALDSSRETANRLFPQIEGESRRQMHAYRELPVRELFRESWVQVPMADADLPGKKGERTICPRCGEGVNFGRFAVVGGERLCLTCAHPELRYWTAQ